MSTLKTSLLFASGIALVACGISLNTEPYPEFARASYLESCNAGGEDGQPFCNCSLQRIEATIPFEEFTDGDITKDSRFNAAVERCARDYPPS